MMLIGNLQFLTYHYYKFHKQHVVVHFGTLSMHCSIRTLKGRRGRVPIILRRVIIGRRIVD